MTTMTKTSKIQFIQYYLKKSFSFHFNHSDYDKVNNETLLNFAMDIGYAICEQEKVEMRPVLFDSFEHYLSVLNGYCSCVEQAVKNEYGVEIHLGYCSKRDMHKSSNKSIH